MIDYSALQTAEGKVIASLLQLSPQRISAIAHETGVNRPNLYRILPTLIASGCVCSAKNLYWIVAPAQQTVATAPHSGESIGKTMNIVAFIAGMIISAVILLALAAIALVLIKKRQ